MLNPQLYYEAYRLMANSLGRIHRSFSYSFLRISIIDTSSIFYISYKTVTGLAISAIGLTILAILVNRAIGKRTKDVPSVLLWKITLKSNNNEIEALGTDEKTLKIVLTEWKENMEKWNAASVK